MLTLTLQPKQQSSRKTIPNHASRRMQQRAISADAIQIALQYGQKTYSHGRQCFTLTDRILVKTPYTKQCDQLRGLCVVVGPNGDVVTVKWQFSVTAKSPKLPRWYS